MIKRFFLIIAFLLLLGQVKAQMIAVRSDLFKDAAMIPNAGLELVVGNRHTLGMELFGAMNPWGVDAEAIGLSPRFRYWLSGRPFSRLFVGAVAQFTNYDIKWSGKAYQGNAFSAGVMLGYTFNISQKLNIEISCGTELLTYGQKKYNKKEDSYIFYGERINSHGTMLFPRLEVSLLYIIR